ncbi:MAG TPA: choice-of-anchor Q domain-containing protein [Anaerolineales bacterium]|nr:choice-of-anchor Q domain-containing protein [Anaerolineales bacterium]
MKPELRIFRFLSLALCLITLIAHAPFLPARAATLTVTTHADSGPGSLRETIQNATDGDTILFAPALAGATIRFSAPITVDKSLTIDGSALTLPVILSGDSDGDGIGDVALFTINAGRTVIINHLVFTKGKNASSGGGIRNYGDLTILNSTFTENHASGWGGAIDNNASLTVSHSTFESNLSDQNGGAIDNYNAGSIIPATLTITESTFTFNRSLGAGGAIYNNGMLSIQASTFSQNQAQDGNMGGAILNFYDFGILILTDSTFIANSAEGEGGAIANIGDLTVRDTTFETNQGSNGGAIYNYWVAEALISSSTFKTNFAFTSTGGAIFNEGGNFGVVNSTFYGNEATWEGGGIANEYNNQSPYNTLIVTHSTFSENSANYGGGILNDTSYLYLSNTLIANSPSGGDCQSIYEPETNINNLIEDGGCEAALSGNPLLGALGDYGGKTPTMPLLPGSPALDAGDDPTCAADPVNHLDQRGLPRPSGSHCDIGAYEHQAIPPTVLAIQRADPSPTNADSVRFTITFSEDVTGVNGDDFVLTTSGLTGVSLTDLVGAGSHYTITVATGTGAGTLRLDLLDDDTIQNSYSLPLGGVGMNNGSFTTGEVYTLVSSFKIYLPLLVRAIP